MSRIPRIQSDYQVLDNTGLGLRGIVCKNGAIYGHSESGVITLIRP